MGRDCFDLVDLGWCGLGWDDLRFLEGTGDDGVFEGDVCVVGGQVSGMEMLSKAENLFLVRRGCDLGVNEDL